MPRVTIRTGIIAPDGQEEVLTEYICDWPDCPNVAEHVTGVVRELAFAAVMCKEHAAMLRKPKAAPDSN
jgi:hypothetical protein